MSGSTRGVLAPLLSTLPLPLRLPKPWALLHPLPPTLPPWLLLLLLPLFLPLLSPLLPLCAPR